MSVNVLKSSSNNNSNSNVIYLSSNTTQQPLQQQQQSPTSSNGSNDLLHQSNIISTSSLYQHQESSPSSVSSPLTIQSVEIKCKIEADSTTDVKSELTVITWKNNILKEIHFWIIYFKLEKIQFDNKQCRVLILNSLSFKLEENSSARNACRIQKRKWSKQ